MIRGGARRLAAALIRRESGCARKISTPILANARCFDPNFSPWRTLAPIGGSLRPFCAGSGGGKGEERSIEAEEIFLVQEKLNMPLGEGEEEELTPAAAREAADADEFKGRYELMQAMSSKLQHSIVAMGALQLLSGWWIVATKYEAQTLYFFFTGLSATLSFQIAYLLHDALKPPAKLADSKVLTLPLVSVRSMANFLARTHLIMCISATGLAGAFAYEVAPSLF